MLYDSYDLPRPHDWDILGAYLQRAVDPRWEDKVQWNEGRRKVVEKN